MESASGSANRRGLALALAVLVMLTGCSIYTGPVSDHYNGATFHNSEADNGFLDHMKWMWSMEATDWPQWIDDPHQPAPASAVHGADALRVSYVNHATVLIQAAELNILTDPIWSDRAGPFSFIGAKRIRAPGVRFDDLPKIDLVLISHDHYDHLDLPTLRRLVSRDHPLILTGLGVKARLASIGSSSVEELDWWQEYPLQKGGGKVTFVPTRHSSGRTLLDGNASLWGGFSIQLPAGNVLFMGDTAYGKCIGEIGERFAGFRLAILPIGNYEPRWFMKTQHMNPDDAVRAHEAIRATHSMAVHFATFAEHPEQAVDAHEKDLASALKAHGIESERFWVPAFGEVRDF